MRAVSGNQNQAVVPNNVNLRAVLPELNKSCRRYGIVTPPRLAAFYANSTQETLWFSWIRESGAAEGTFNNYLLSQRYCPWEGRGMIQLTWLANFIKYWRFIGRTVPNTIEANLTQAQQNAEALHRALKASANGTATQQQQQLINTANATIVPPGQNRNARANDYFMNLETAVAQNGLTVWRSETSNAQATPRYPADSGGAFWAWNKISKAADLQPQNTRRTRQLTTTTTVVYYSSDGIRRAAAAVNTGAVINLNGALPNENGINGIVPRYQAYNNSVVVLMDTITFVHGQGATSTVELLPENFVARRP
jgi:hydroxyethylthiazole kinase